MEGWALFCVLAVIILLIIVLALLFKRDQEDEDVPPSSYDYYTPAPAPAPAVKREPAKPAADEQSYYQFSGPSRRQCAFCGCENETGTAQCQVCGKSL